MSGSEPFSLSKSVGEAQALDRIIELLLPITEEIDLQRVLREVVDGARMLSGAPVGCIVTISEAGAPDEFVSAGLSDEEHVNLVCWQDGRRIFESIVKLPAPVRFKDFAAFAQSLGLDWKVERADSVLFMPLFHHGESIGFICVGRKRAEVHFSDRDEQILEVFSRGAAAAIVIARTHQAERRAHGNLEALLDILPVGVVVVDAETGQPKIFTRTAQRILKDLCTSGYPAEQFPRVLIVHLSDGRRISFKESSLKTVLGEFESLHAEKVVISTPDGKNVSAIVDLAPIKTRRGTTEAFVVVVQDTAVVDEGERARAEVLRTLSHELRTPLSAIRGIAATALGSARSLPPSEVEQFFEIIDQQSVQMDTLVGDLLRARRVGEARLSTAIESLNVRDLVERARSAFIASGHKHRVLVDVPGSLPQVLADRARIAQVLNNLLTNAAQHSPESMSIRVSARRDGSRVEILVVDEGEGMGPEHLAELFRTRAGSESEEHAEGGGLGLWICQRLVEAHGGHIWAESAGPGFGTQIAFSIPAVVESESDPAPVVTAPGSNRDSGRRILVLDDDPHSLNLIREALLEADYSPLAMSDHMDLPRVLEAARPDLAVLDLVLPGRDGIGLMEFLPGLSEIPVILVSAYGHDETVVRALRAGAEDYIVKPFSTAEFIARIEVVLRRRAAPELFELGVLRINFGEEQVSVGGRTVELTRTEYKLLRTLALNAGRVVGHEELLRKVWRGGGVYDANLVRTFVKQLRRKLRRGAGEAPYILTERGVGYRIASPEDLRVPVRKGSGGATIVR